MTSFVAFPDIHDQSQHFKTIRHILGEVDAVLLAGDMTNGNSDNLHRLLTILEQYNEQIYAVCGNMDTEAMAMWLAREGMSLHRRHVMLDGIAMLGVGGALPFYGKYVFNESQFEQFLAETLVDVPPNAPKILVCHQPPYGTLCDRIDTGEHVGSKAVRAFIERVQPLVCFTGHIHDAIGIDRIGDCQIINAGPIGRSEQYAYLEIENGAVKTLEIRKVKAFKLFNFGDRS